MCAAGQEWNTRPPRHKYLETRQEREKMKKILKIRPEKYGCTCCVEAKFNKRV